MKQIEKNDIKQKLAEYCELKGSQNKAANSLRGVSSATVTQILRNNWDLINDDMWRNIASQIGYDQRAWVVVETRGYKRMYNLLSDAQDNALVSAVVGDAGCGKSEAIKSYAARHKQVFNLSCSEYWNRKIFLSELLQCMGVDYTGCTVGEMMYEIISALKKYEGPLVILDEADKLSDQVLYFFISIFNKLEDHCGIMLCATDFLEKRIKKGVRTNRKGYKEIYSRVNKRFVPIQIANSEDIAAVCMANGILDENEITKIIDDSDNDLRRVKRLVHAVKSRKS
ncbi:MAG: ATP-binding protein [Prevotellaceae bacterium]|jgi:DNA transposition AAA+ family ATPase|nr:ATP-binding protein [Prevotellaceae bacterium]